MLNSLNIFSKHGGFVLLLVLPLAFTTKAQEHLKSEWVSCSMTYRGKEIELKKKKDKTRLIFQTDKNYIKLYYTHNRNSDPPILSYNSISRKIESTNGQTLKKRKAKEAGTYQVRESEIFFDTGNEKYSAQFQMEGEFLLLTQYGDESLKTRLFTIKFKRVK